jgi:hypothetical protein
MSEQSLNTEIRHPVTKNKKENKKEKQNGDK